MRYAVISDPHADLEALTAVLETASADPSMRVFDFQRFFWRSCLADANTHIAIRFYE